MSGIVYQARLFTPILMLTRLSTESGSLAADSAGHGRYAHYAHGLSPYRTARAKRNRLSDSPRPQALSGDERA